VLQDGMNELKVLGTAIGPQELVGWRLEKALPVGLTDAGTFGCGSEVIGAAAMGGQLVAGEMGGLL